MFGLSKPTVTMTSVLVRISIAVMNRHDQSKLGGGGQRVPLAYTSTSLFIMERSQGRNSNRAGTWRQELIGAEAMEDAAYWLVPHPA